MAPSAGGYLHRRLDDMLERLARTESVDSLLQEALDLSVELTADMGILQR